MFAYSPGFSQGLVELYTVFMAFAPQKQKPSQKPGAPKSVIARHMSSLYLTCRVKSHTQHPPGPS